MNHLLFISLFSENKRAQSHSMNICIFNIFTEHALKIAVYSEETLDSVDTDGLIQRNRTFSLSYKDNCAASS